MFLLLAACPPLLLLTVLWRQHRKAIRALARSEAQIAQQRVQITHLSRVMALGEFSGALTHEISQPLTAILMNAEVAARLLKSRTIDIESLGESLDDILGCSRHILAVVGRLRELLHRDNGKAATLPMNLSETAHAVLDLARSDLARRRVRVEAHFAPQLANVRGDRVHIQQVILNLIVNACEAMGDMPADERCLTLATRSGPKAREVELFISDCGVGIEPLELERIFQPFVTTKADGLGLGLPICRSIVEAHGGKIWAEHRVPGAAFHLVLPTCE